VLWVESFTNFAKLFGAKTEPVGIPPPERDPQRLVGVKAGEFPVPKNGKYFQNKDGLWICRYEWPLGDPKGVVFVVHGCSRA